MARSERITLRLYPEERQRFEEEAREADMKLNPYLRRKLGLSNLGEPKAVIPVYGTGPEPGPISSEDLGALWDEKAFKQKVARIMGKENCDRETAERKVREELG